MVKSTAAQIKKQTKEIQEAIELEKRRFQGQNFSEARPEDVEKKLRRAKQFGTQRDR